MDAENGKLSSLDVIWLSHALLQPRPQSWPATSTNIGSNEAMSTRSEAAASDEDAADGAIVAARVAVVDIWEGEIVTLRPGAIGKLL